MLRELVAKGKNHTQLLLGAALIGGIACFTVAAYHIHSISSSNQLSESRALSKLDIAMTESRESLALLYNNASIAINSPSEAERKAAADYLNSSVPLWSVMSAADGARLNFQPVAQSNPQLLEQFEDQARELDNKFKEAQEVYRQINALNLTHPPTSVEARNLLNSLAEKQKPVADGLTALKQQVQDIIRNQERQLQDDKSNDELLTLTFVILGTCLLTIPGVFYLRRLVLSLDEASIQNRKLAAVAENPINFVAIADMEGAYVWVNQGFTRITGYSLQEAQGKSLIDLLIDPLNQEPSALSLRESVIKSTEFNGQVRIQNKDGSNRWLLLHRYNLGEANGRHLGFASVGVDVTAEVNSQNLLRASQARLEDAMRASNDGLWEWNPQTNQMYLSSRWFEMLGYAEGDFPAGANAMQTLSHPDDRAAAYKAMDDHLSGKSPRFYMEHRLRNKSGQWRWVLGRAMVTARDEAGKPLKVTGTISDIHDRKLADDRFKTLFETSPYANLLTSSTTVLDANEAAVALLGFKSKDQLIGKPKADFFPTYQPSGEPSAQMCNSYWEKVAAGQPIRFDWHYKHADGHSIPTFVAINPIQIGGELYGIVVVQDMTVQRQVESSLRRSELRYQLAVRGTRLGIWEWNIQTDEVFFTQAMCDLMGIASSERISGIEGVLKFAYPDDIPRIKRALSDHLQDHKPFDLEYRVRGKNGFYRWFRATGQATWDERSKPVLMVGALNDITQAKLANLALAKSEAMLTDSQSIARLGSWYYDVRNNDLVWSKETFRLFGLDPATDPTPTFEQCERFVHPEDAAHWKINIESALVEGAGLDFEFQINRRDGQNAYLWCRGSAKKDENGRVIELSGTFQDCTRVRHTEAQLRQQTDKLLATTHDLENKQNELLSQKREIESERVKAELANKTKSEFLANMSHEIRTPMTAILGFAEMLSDPNVTPEVRSECVQTIRRNGLHLLEIINDILDLSKIEAGKMDMESIPCKTRDIVDEVVTLMRVRASAKAIDLRVEYATPVPATFKTDPTRLRQILINLVSNAIKFTERGGVSVEIRYLPAARPDGPSMLEFNIRDTGIGMSHEQVEKLFQVFTQADSSTTRRFGGTGLGLAISGRLAKLMGGDIKVRSEPNIGSTFTLTVLAANPEGIISHAEAGEVMLDDAPASDAIRIFSEGREALSGIHILLAEDGPDNRRFITFILEEAGANVDSVENGQDAVRQVLLSQKTNNPVDLVLMDIQMPIMDGYTAARTLRNNGWKGPVIALTAHAMVGERERCLAAGCNEYQTKPVDRIRLLRSIKDLVAAARPQQAFLRAQPRPEDAAPAAPVRPQSTRQATGPLFSTLSGNPRVAGLIVDYVRGLGEYAAKFDAALSANDLESARVMAHHLKGSGTMYGFPTITETASRAERIIKQKSDPDGARSAIRELISVCRRATVQEKV